MGREAEERLGAQEKISGKTMNSIDRLGHFVVREDREGITARLCHCPQVGPNSTSAAIAVTL